MRIAEHKQALSAAQAAQKFGYFDALQRTELSAAQAAQKIFNQLVRCGYMLSAAQAAQKSDEKSHT